MRTSGFWSCSVPSNLQSLYSCHSSHWRQVNQSTRSYWFWSRLWIHAQGLYHTVWCYAETLFQTEHGQKTHDITDKNQSPHKHYTDSVSSIKCKQLEWLTHSSHADGNSHLRLWLTGSHIQRLETGSAAPPHTGLRGCMCRGVQVCLTVPLWLVRPRHDNGTYHCCGKSNEKYF